MTLKIDQPEGRGRLASSPVQPIQFLAFEDRLGLVRRRRRSNVVRRLAIGPLLVGVSVVLIGAVSGVAAVR